MEGSVSRSLRPRRTPDTNIDSQHSQSENIEATSSAAEGSVPASTAQQARSPRKRRLLTRSTRAVSTTRQAVTTADNHEAGGSAPKVRMPSKRKASSSSKSSDPGHVDRTVAPSDFYNVNPPTVAADDVFGTNGSFVSASAGSSPVLSGAAFFDSSDEDQELLELDLQAYASAAQAPARPGVPNLFPNALGLHDILSQRRATQTTKPTSQKLSAVLIQREDNDLGSTHQNEDVTGSGKFRYLPLCIAPRAFGGAKGSKKGPLTVLPDHRSRIEANDSQLSHNKALWPANELPVELFDLIVDHLARDDVKSMRLVNHEFERKVSRSLFHTCVVPFNTELYDMIDEDKRVGSRVPPARSKDKGKARMVDRFQDPVDSSSLISPGGLQWQNATEDKEGKVYKGHGLRVFQGFGPHIKRFGMSFEVSEKQLSQTMTKHELDHVESYHGAYDWPSAQYARFPSLAGLENTADETSRMKAAFSTLDKVRELALSIDSGLGWLNGSDRSIHAKLFERPSKVFGSSYTVPDHDTQAATEFWSALEHSQRSLSGTPSMKEIALDYIPMKGSAAELPGLHGQVYSDTHLWSSIDKHRVPVVANATSSFGVLYTTTGQSLLGDLNAHKAPLVPAELTKVQKEWLLETQWAQQAFLESYVLAIVDNPTIFEKVTNLNLAKISGRYLPMLGREVFWDALPCIKNVTIHVSPDWRNVEKDDAGLAVTRPKSPSETVQLFLQILQERIAPRQSIKSLNIGWIGGGEHAEGIFARNQHILPAPTTPLDYLIVVNSPVVHTFKHVEHLTLSNCWMTPPMLVGLVNLSANHSLKKLTLDSVSLTAHPRFPATGPLPNIAQVVAAVQAQLGNNGITPMQQQVLFHQQQQQALQQHAALLGPNVQPQQLLHLYLNQMGQNQGNQQGAQAQLPNAFAFHNLPLQPNNPAAPAAPAVHHHWTSQHREGSWAYVLDKISPGPIFADYLPVPEPWDEQLPSREERNLQCIELKSCGYTKLPHHTGFDQTVLELDGGRLVASPLSTWFRSRHSSLKGAMMTAPDRFLGQIVQHIPQRELDALLFAWGLRDGWQDLAKAEETEFDGLLSGGTGRVSGVVRKGMALVGQSAASSSRVD